MPRRKINLRKRIIYRDYKVKESTVSSSYKEGGKRSGLIIINSQRLKDRIGQDVTVKVYVSR